MFASMSEPKRDMGRRVMTLMDTLAKCKPNSRLKLTAIIAAFTPTH